MAKIVEVLLSQHRELRSILEEMKDQASQAKDCSQLMVSHESFLNLLKGHLSLENDFFYPKMLEGMKKRSIPETQMNEIVSFISKMKDIEKQVLEFFHEYATVESISNAQEQYLHDLDAMISVLLLRIETEEDGVYVTWDFLGIEE